MKNFTFKAVCFFAIALSLNSCQEQELDIQEPVSVTDELEKIETIFNDADIKIETDIIDISDFKIETDSGDFKIETDANFTLREKIEEELLESFTKQKTFSKASNSNLVAVFSSGYCTNLLQIHMDCEDSRPASRIVGYKAGNWLDSRKNVSLRFCITPNNFVRTNHDYAVLNLTSNVPNSTYRIDRLFDNEDRNNANRSTINYVRAYGWRGNTSLSGGNLQLSWIMYPKTTLSQNFPSVNYSSSYGVLGKFGSSSRRGYVFTDDEDNRNANRCNIYKYSSTGARTLVSNRNERASVLANIIGEGSNTTLYLSKVN